MKTMTEFKSAIENLPRREGPAPRMTPSNPQEQLEQFPDDWTWVEQLGTHAFALAKVIEAPTRIAPPGSRALTLDSDDARGDSHAFMVDLEFAHIHNPPIGSMHMTLPPSLRDAAIERGWALRHPLALRGIVSPDIVFVFAPRSDAELSAAKVLLEASHAYATGVLAN
jgi:phospholipase/carboxylesterase